MSPPLNSLIAERRSARSSLCFLTENDPDLLPGGNGMTLRRSEPANQLEGRGYRELEELN